jgi:hypothetical protein
MKRPAGHGLGEVMNAIPVGTARASLLDMQER